MIEANAAIDAGAVDMELVPISNLIFAAIGSGSVPVSPVPNDAIAFVVDLEEYASLVSFTLYGGFGLIPQDDLGYGQKFILVASHAECEHIYGRALNVDQQTEYYLPAPLRDIVEQIRSAGLPQASQRFYRSAKSMELLYELLRLLASGMLTPFSHHEYSEADANRIFEARKIIDERWHTKLTLGEISTKCGLNRTKLTAGFKKIFNCTVADAIAERRLTAAKRMLMATDLPISTIGYRCGYLNNASFARAFARKFGVAPTKYRLLT